MNKCSRLMPLQPRQAGRSHARPQAEAEMMAGRRQVSSESSSCRGRQDVALDGWLLVNCQWKREELT